MTEEEAKTKWCPFARSLPGMITAGGATFEDARLSAHNRVGGTKAVGACIGSACMAWRVSGTKHLPGSISEIVQHMKANKVGPLDATGATGSTVSVGYCGLAGAPQ